MMDYCTLTYAICTGLMIGGYHSETTEGFKLDINAIQKTTRPYFPIIPDISYHEAIEKLKELWVTQTEYLNTLQRVSVDIKNITRYAIPQFGWVYNDTKARIETQIRVLSEVPLQNNTEEMREALDDDTIREQKRSWDAMEICLNDHYEFEKKDEHENLFRKTLETAREELLRRQKEIKALVKEKTNSTKS